MENQNRLKPENCNKAKCKTCIFRTDGKGFKLTDERMQEIKLYLIKFESSHVCHVTEKTCYGALELQAKTLHSMGVIPDDKVETMLETAQKYI